MGCGHSLGGTVMHELAYRLQNNASYSFTRVDVFNPGASIFHRMYTPVSRTQFYSHRVVGDIVSYWYQSVGKTLEYEPKAEYNVHAMGHFLPNRHKTKLSL